MKNKFRVDIQIRGVETYYVETSTKEECICPQCGGILEIERW